MEKILVKDQLKEHIYQDIRSVAETDIPWDRLKDKTVLITGAGGFISYYLAAALLMRNDSRGSNIRVLGMVRNLERAREKFGTLAERDDLILIAQDVCEPFRFSYKADYVIHAASQASAWHFEHDPVGTINANLTGTMNVLEYARKCNSAVLFISSLKTYGDVKDGSMKLTEAQAGFLDHDSYRNCYAVGKRAAETLCACWHKQYGVSVKIARPSYIYGASTLEDDRVWAQFLANVVRHENILLKSNGGAYRSFCYVSDTAEALLKILLSGEEMQPYNIASDNSNVTIRGFARLAVEAFPERHLTLSFENPEDEKEPIVDYKNKTPEILDSSRLLSLGWSAKVGIIEGIRRSVAILEERK